MQFTTFRLRCLFAFRLSFLLPGKRAGFHASSSLSTKSVLVALLACAVYGSAQNGIEQQYPITWQFNVKVPMRDGVKLATDIIRPDTKDRFPALLIRTPYNKGIEPARDDPAFFASHGYPVVIQDVRGRYDSEGEWQPFLHEADDGYDSQQWVASQPWCNGDVITYGGSYLSLDQWLAASRRNPHLKGMVTMVGHSDLYQNLFHPGGSFQEGVSVIFGDLVDGRVVQEQDFAFLPWQKAFNTLPVAGALMSVGRNPTYYRDWISHSNYDSYWQDLAWDKVYEQIDFPILYIGGWFDLFQTGTIGAFQQARLSARGRVRDAQHLIVGPWVHESAGGDPVLRASERQGDWDFGPESAMDLRSFVLHWIDHYAKGLHNEVEHSAPIQVFTMGENAWHGYAEWPVPGTVNTTLYLHSNGKANGAGGDGTLSASRATGEPQDTYVYDPAAPVPTTGGGNCCGQTVLASGPMDQRSVERRDDVLVYTSAPLQHDLRVTGKVTGRVWVASSTLDTDFTLKLVDVYPNGFALNLTDGIVRAKFRESYRQPKLLAPGQLYELTITAGNTSNVFKKDHRIRIEISSSNFPRFSRNTNTGTTPELDTHWIVATQTIVHNSEHPSSLTLPVLNE
jgi:putative CocE/NonD family hydrolase